MKFFYTLCILILTVMILPSQALPVEQINLLDLELDEPHTADNEQVAEADLQRVTRGLGGFDFGGKFGGLGGGLGGLKGGFGGLGHGFGGGFGGLGHGFGGGLGSFKGLFNKF
ncbi:glycine-rich RNA-binding protein 1 [Drosophila willistoni]|uniref:glycine-rich RNA-binding protein 1 n=1 Tax=Drosophila willistoni TaxID=7260 RepID=UPI00017D66C6|nr:glycine-rich RNA-binding protein 1 [Drosophila willistoni]